MFSRFRGVVWSTVLAVVCGALNVFLSLLGANIAVVVAVGLLGLSFAAMSPRS